MTSQITVCQAFTSSPTLTSLSPYPETPSPPEPASPIFGVLLQVEVGASPHGHVTALEWDNEGSYTMEQGQGWVPLTPPNHGNTIWKEVCVKQRTASPSSLHSQQIFQDTPSFTHNRLVCADM